jgi:hypothetical protein
MSEIDIFISFPHQNEIAAMAACLALEDAGYGCWIAPRDIIPGHDWSESIIDAISASKLMVLIFSNHANLSPQVKREVERAVNRNIPIIPFRVENIPPSKSLEYFISTQHWLNAFTPPLEKHLRKLIHAANSFLANHSPRPEKKADEPETYVHTFRYQFSPVWRLLSSMKPMPITYNVTDSELKVTFVFNQSFGVIDKPIRKMMKMLRLDYFWGKDTVLTIPRSDIESATVVRPDELTEKIRDWEDSLMKTLVYFQPTYVVEVRLRSDSAQQFATDDPYGLVSALNAS